MSKRLNTILKSLCCVSLSWPLLLFTACSPQQEKKQDDDDQLPLFDIKEGTLYGFNSNLNPEQIKKKIKDDTLVIPNNVKAIYDDAFYDDSKSTIPDNVTKISFLNPNWLLEIGENAFRKAPFKSFEVPQRVKTIFPFAFCDSKIENLVFNTDTDTLIDECAFSGCESLKRIVFSNSTYKFEKLCFANLSNLEFIDFSRCDSTYFSGKKSSFLSSGANQCTVMLKNDVKIAEWVTFLVDEKFPIEKIKSECIENLFNINKDGVLLGFKDGVSMEKIAHEMGSTFYIPPNVTEIAQNAFNYEVSPLPESIENLKLPPYNKLELIDQKAFYGSKFKNINLVASNKITIDSNAFATSSCKNVSIMNNIKDTNATYCDIGTTAFSDLNDLTSLEIDPSNSTIRERSFTSTPNLNVIKLNNSRMEINFDHWESYNFWDAASQGKILIDTFVSKQKVLDYFYFLTWDVIAEIDSAFDITSEGLLNGFNPKLTEEELKKVTGNTVLIPSNVKTIANNAFQKKLFEENKIIDFEPNSKCTRIGDNAFSENSLETVKLPEHIKEINDFAFAKNNISTINISRVHEMPIYWSGSAWSDNSDQINIVFDQNLKSFPADQLFIYFNKISNGAWKFDKHPQATFKLEKKDPSKDDEFKIIGFKNFTTPQDVPSDYFCDNTLYIPSEYYYDDNDFKLVDVVEIGPYATCYKDGEQYKTLLPSSVTSLSFLPKNGTLHLCNTIASNAFCGAHFEKITLPPTIIHIAENAFANCFNINFIDVSEVDSIPDWNKKMFTINDNFPKKGTIKVKSEKEIVQFKVLFSELFTGKFSWTIIW